MSLTKVNNRMIDGSVVNILDYIPASEHAAIKAGTSTYNASTDIQTAIQSGLVVFLPSGTYRVESTIQVGPRGRGLIGESPQTSFTNNALTKIIFDGTASKTTAVILIGSNGVGVDPVTDASSNIVKNIQINANNKAGFCIYGTYITNETEIDNLTLLNSTEYNAYFAKGWYSKITNITSKACRGKGIALGMPLEYLDGTSGSSGWSEPLELNQVKLDNIRSIDAGQYFSVDNTGTYDPTNTNLRREGYGIGAGFGNGFTLTNLLSEKSGGVNLYVYNGSQPRKVVQFGYLESSGLNSGLNAASTLPNIIIENTSGAATPIEIRDIFCNFNSGGIFHTGNTGSIVWLKNIHQPRFLSSLDGISSVDLQKVVLKDNVRSDAGFTNLEERIMFPAGYGVVDTTSSFTINVLPGGGRKVIYVKSVGPNYYGSMNVNFEDGTTQNIAFPTLTTSYQYAALVSSDVVSITKAGGTGSPSDDVSIKVMTTPITFL